jgi:uncharacterized lipoprotein YddW (UPF0748 family)
MRLFFLLIFFFLPVLVHSQHGKIRALWVVRDALESHSHIDQVINTASESQMTDIFVQVRALGRTYYDSKLEPTVSCVEIDFDPLQIILEKTKHSGIRVHAWVNMFYIWASQDAPREKSHIFNTNTSNILRNGGFPDYKTLKKEGIEGFFVDPQNENIQNYLLNLLREIVDSYGNIAGIHLDYFRYPGIMYSFTPENRTKFRLVNFYDPLKMYNYSETYALERGHEVFQQADKIYRNNLIESLTSYLKDINNSLKNMKTNLKLSVAVKPDPIQAKLRFFQDWLTWLKKNYCDFITIMNYRTDLNEFQRIINQLKDNHLQKKIVVGISTYNQNFAAVNKRLDLVNGSDFAGFSLFSYNYLAKHEHYYRSLQLRKKNGGKNGL